MAHYIQSDGPSIQERGREATKEPHPVWLVESDAPFSVSTNEGTLTGNPGDHIAYDPTSGHIWPVSAEYVDMHYVFADESADVAGTLADRADARETELRQQLADLDSENDTLRQQLAETQQQKAEAQQQLQETQQQLQEWEASHAAQVEEAKLPDESEG